ncbi:MAG: hypothetical protein MH825_11755 [Cyanobacteria bacterium]|nr:hypothetical protein [Cyanobacteriota bacterium]
MVSPGRGRFSDWTGNGSACDLGEGFSLESSLRIVGSVGGAIAGAFPPGTAGGVGYGAVAVRRSGAVSDGDHPEHHWLLGRSRDRLALCLYALVDRSY